jgi:tRNA pseudouridine38-40 synthase
MLLRIAYDGTDFRGFARHADTRTVQGTLEAALSALYGQPVAVRGASRTDAGVHARGQLVAFEPPTSIPAEGVVMALAGSLPADLVACAAWEEHDPSGAPVEPRFENGGKRYGYRIRCARLRNPLTDRLEWQIPRPLDLSAMRASAPALVGEHDFRAFRAADCQATTTVRRIHSVSIGELPWEVEPPPDPGRPGLTPRLVHIEVAGEAFLRNMVRIVVGTLVEVGLGRREPAEVADILRSGDRRQAGPTAPARGLTLLEVLWSPRSGRPRGSVGR